jgi:hypothetical protein
LILGVHTEHPIKKEKQAPKPAVVVIKMSSDREIMISGGKVTEEFITPVEVKKRLPSPQENKPLK